MGQRPSQDSARGDSERLGERRHGATRRAGLTVPSRGPAAPGLTVPSRDPPRPGTAGSRLGTKTRRESALSVTTPVPALRGLTPRGHRPARTRVPATPRVPALRVIALRVIARRFPLSESSHSPSHRPPIPRSPRPRSPSHRSPSLHTLRVVPSPRPSPRPGCAPGLALQDPERAGERSRGPDPSLDPDRNGRPSHSVPSCDLWRHKAGRVDGRQRPWT